VGTDPRLLGIPPRFRAHVPPRGADEVGRRVGALIGALFLLALVPGCLTLSPSRPVAVQALDAETNKPIPGAEVHLSYPLNQSPFAPADCSATAGPDGIARLSATPYGDEGVHVGVSAPGYLSEGKALTAEFVQAIERAQFFEAVERRPANVVVALYAGPNPTVELVLPVGYRGLVKAEVVARNDIPCPPGQRSFSTTVPASGVVQVTGPLLLRRVGEADFGARFADGTPLRITGEEKNVGLWLLSAEGTSRYTFYVGTPREHDDYLRLTPVQAKAAREVAGGGKGGGRGRGGRRGNQSSSDSSTGGTMP
jgi:hypothetical protein